MVAVPALTPPTPPLVAPMVAVEALLVLHVPPVVASVSVVDAPTHTLAVPDMAAGSGLTVTVRVTKQPVSAV